VKKTLVLWLVLVGLFVFFYVGFRRTAPDGDERPPVALVDFLPWLTVVALFVFFLVFLWLNSRWLKGHNEGIVLLQQGRAVEALEHFKTARAHTKSALPVLNVGIASLQVWLLPEAISALEEFRTRGGSVMKGGAPGTMPLASAALALAYALRGERARAQAMVAESAGSATGRLAEVVIAARSGEWIEAQRLLTQHALLLDQLGGPHRALTDAVQALVASKLGVPGGRVDRVRLFRETSGEGLKQAWPELVEFVDRVAAGPQVPAAV
jgi:hypothetical protein